MDEHPKDFVRLTEVGPRDGFQFESKVVPTNLKCEIIEALSESGLNSIQIAAFVHPRRVPQMADAEALFARISHEMNIDYNALALNVKGVERACSAGVRSIEISLSASDTHSRKNTGMTLNQAVEQVEMMVQMAKRLEMTIKGSIQCAFGCVYEGHIPEKRVIKLAQRFMASRVNSLCLSDTTGMATPISIRSLSKSVLDMAGDIPVGLHLHDTRGLGLVNVMAALECGVRHFDTSFAGMGGCPFVLGAAGNIATEDTVYLLQTLGMQTGVDWQVVAGCSNKMEQFFEKQFPGKMHRLTNNVCVDL
jgi:hydroxymethylglutaryl-CoA lyase